MTASSLAFGSFRHLVPQDRERNKDFRKWLVDAAHGRPVIQRAIREICKADPWFYFSTFLVTREPRRMGDDRVVPFIPYDFQNQFIEVLIEAMGFNGFDPHDLCVPKSRDMGGTHVPIGMFDWACKFYPMVDILLGSRKAELVYKPGDHKALFTKLVDMQEGQPAWMGLPELKMMHAEYPLTGSVIDGEATVSNFARGDRRTVIYIDELASWGDADEDMLDSTIRATDCRIFVSTPKGVGNAFHSLWKSEHIRKFPLFWTSHPRKRKGLYRSDGGVLTILDSEYWDAHPEKRATYKFVIDGRTRSLEYDADERRTKNPDTMAQEWDMDFESSGDAFFSPATIQSLLTETARKPLHRGGVHYDQETAEFIEFTPNEEGRMFLWCPLDMYGKPPQDTVYVISCDPAVGATRGNTGSFASAVVADARTRTKVAEFAARGIGPTDFAMLVYALCRWFTGNDGRMAYLIWETNGPGRVFGEKMCELGHRYVYWREKQESVWGKKSLDTPGWFASRGSKRAVFEEYKSALARREYVNRSESALLQCLEYRYSGGTIEHSQSTHTNTETMRGENHGDLVVADALAWKVLRTHFRAMVPQIDAPPAAVPDNCLASRRERRRIRERQLADPW